MPSSSRHLLFFLFLLMAPACARQFPGTAPEAVSHVRSFYFNHDFEAGMHEGNSLIHRFPENLELRAWYLLNLTNSGIANNPAPRDSARTIAEHLTETSPQSPWGWFALAEVLNAPSLMVISAPEIGRFRIGVPTAEALAASRRALDLAPDHPDILWMRARTLRHHGQKDEFNTFVEQCKAANRTTVELLNVIADSAAFAEATTRDPNNAEAYYFRGRFFTWSRNLEKAYPLLKKACTLAPHSSEIHQLYWQTLLQKKDNKPEEIQKEIESDITTFLKNRTMHATSLVAVLEIYGEMGLVEKQRELADRILRDLSDSPAAEWPLTIRYRNYADSVFQANPNKIQTLAHDETYRDMLRNFIRRPHHNDPRLLAAAYTALFACLKEDPQEDPVVLLETVNNILRYDQARFSFQAPGYVIALTERTSSFQEIERIAQTGIQKIKSLLADARPPAWSDAEWDTWLDKQPPFTTMHDALGWLYFKQGRFQDAETYLLKSNEHQPRYVTNLYHLGKFYESRNHLQKAENFYLRGLKIQQPGENPCETALQNLHAKLQGKSGSFEDYLTQLKGENSENRKQKIMTSRIQAPEFAPAFDLKTLDGKNASLKDLRGKIVLINFWGLWCGWCLREMPEFQKLHEIYRNDPDVVVLTINNDKNAAPVSSWMQKQEYTFPVLLDDGYVNLEASISAFPTTWFLDRQGRITFEKAGWTKELVEEFTWRIEALREP